MILLIFLDGVGLGDNDAQINPFITANLPTLHTFTNGSRWTRHTGTQTTKHSLFIPTDPRMGVAGRPQSGSGQAAIITGRNIPQLIGEHYGPKPNEPIRSLLEEDNIFIRLVCEGYRAAILEAYPPPWHQSINSGKRLPSSYQYAANAANLRFFTVDDYRAGRALSGDWTGTGWREQLGFHDTPLYTPYEAGVRLVEIASRYDFAFFPHWLTDVMGHRGTFQEAVALLETFDSVMHGILDTWDDNMGYIIVTSDHGNLEAMNHRKHTENDVPTLIIGSHPQDFAKDIRSLADIAPRILDFLI